MKPRFIASETRLLYNERGKKGSLTELRICRSHHTADHTRPAVKKSFQTLCKFATKSFQGYDKVLTGFLQRAMDKQTKHFYEFGAFRLDLIQRILLRGNQVVALTPKAFETLLILVQHHGHIVEKDYLMKAIWPDTFVEEVSLARNVSALRKVLGVTDSGIQYIETFPKRGYRFVAAVSEHREEATQSSGSPTTLAQPSLEEVLATTSVHEAGQTFGAQMSSHTLLDDEAERLPQPQSPILIKTVADDSALQVKAEATSEAITSYPSSEPLSGNRNFIKLLNRHKIAALLALAGLLIGILITAVVLRSDKQPPATLQEMKIVRLTDNGNAGNPAISPDGKYIAYEISENRKHSLWLKDIVSNSEVQIVAPTGDDFMHLAFSRNGSYLYYVKLENRVGILYQSPVFGGESKKLIEDIASHITFSPDGNRIAFIRTIREGTFPLESALIIANADGSGEQTLAIRKKPDFFTRAPAWSPAGKTIACIIDSSSSPRQSNLVEVSLEDGSEKPIGSRKWSYIGGLAWFADGSHLVINAREPSASLTQIWILSYLDGKERRVTNDLADYYGLSLSANSGALAVRQVDQFLNIWIVPDMDMSRAKQITAGSNFHDAVSWTPDGKILFSTDKNGNQSIWTIEANGTGEKNVSGMALKNESPIVSPDGRYIVFTSNRTGSINIWRMDSDGSNPKQLTQGELDRFPHFSSDGQWIIYSSSANGQALNKVSIDGGNPFPVIYEAPSLSAATIDVSPDGKQVASLYKEGGSSSKWGIAIHPFEGGKALKRFEIPVTFNPRKIRWLPNGQAISYINTVEGVSNIWMHPLNGGPPKQLTSFNTEEIYAFDWSRDGKNLACIRGYSTSDIVLISNFK
jgi:Tol biopolymer transport system component/DNA-binding winged helix-turn-helix (wHTH) protein